MNKYAPARSSIQSRDYISYRRLWLDACLSAASSEMCGVVLDLGGKREEKRGAFRPPEAQADAWWYINMDADASPNLRADVLHLPIGSRSADCIICTEVLEHVRDAQTCVAEMQRVLRPGGIAFVSAPFMYPVHADPFDFHRFTGDGLRLLFEEFASIEIIPMGGFWGTLGMLLEIGIEGMANRSPFQRALRGSLRRIARRLCAYDLSTYGAENVVWNKYTTGYFVQAIR